MASHMSHPNAHTAMPRTPAPDPAARPDSIPPDDTPAFPMDVLRARAERMARIALEACRQHERCAELYHRTGVDPAELKSQLEMTALANRQLAEAVADYEKAASKARPKGEDTGDPWRRRANVLWMAARDHLRRNETGARLERAVAAQHSADQLGELHVAYELEASAILSLLQAAGGLEAQE